MVPCPAVPIEVPIEELLQIYPEQTMLPNPGDREFPQDKGVLPTSAGFTRPTKPTRKQPTVRVEETGRQPEGPWLARAKTWNAAEHVRTGTLRERMGGGGKRTAGADIIP